MSDPVRALTAEEQALIARRRAGFEPFLRERIPVLIAFLEALELPDPPQVMFAAEQFLPGLDRWMKDQAIKDEDRDWLLIRFGYFTGEYFVQRYGGSWYLHETPDSPAFARYVVGRFRKLHPNALLDPINTAFGYLSMPAGRSLTAALAEADRQLCSG